MSVTSLIKRVLNKLVRKSYWYNHIEFDDCAKFWHHRTFEMDVVNLGSTSALTAFDYSAYPQLKAANWAMAPQTSLADYEILRNYSCYLRDGATVIIPLCPFTSLGGSKDYFSDKYYTVLDIASIPHASYVKKQQVMERKKNPFKYYPIMQIFTRKPKQKQLIWDEASLVKDAKMRMECWMKEFSIIRFTDPLSLVNQDAYDDTAVLIKRMVDFCYERNYRPVLVIPPVFHTLGELFTSEIRKKILDSLINRIEDKTVWYYNYMDEIEFTNDSSLFQNSFLMNEKGAKLFTKRVLKDLGLIQ